jgi:hypothetical protein
VGTRIPTGFLLVAGFVLLVVLPEFSIITGALMIVAGAVRVHDLRRGRLGVVPWPLTIIAVLMPRPGAHNYLESLGHNANEVRGRERRRHMWDAVLASPGTLVTVWHGWLRSKLVAVTVWALADRVDQVQQLLKDAAVDPGRRHAALRRLRRYCRLILCVTGNAHRHECAVAAFALLQTLRQSADSRGDAELDARIRRDVEKLACALTSPRPDPA